MSYNVGQKRVKFITLGLFVLFLTGCASTARHSQMTVNRNEVARKNSTLVKNMNVENVMGGKKTNPLWTSQVDNEGFSQALTNSLSNVDYLNSDPEKSRFKLAATIQELKQPLIGIDFEVVCKAKYTLYDKKLKKMVFDKSVVTPYTASFSSSMYAPNRLKLANEGAVKENIKQFLEELNTL